MEFLQAAVVWLSNPRLQVWAIPFALVCYFIIFRYWKGLSPVVELGERLGDVTGHATSGFARRLLGHIRRMMRQANTIGGIVKACITGLIFRLVLGAALALAVLFITGVAMQPYLGTPIGDATARINDTAAMLGAGLLDALTFDLFSIWGIDLRPDFVDLRPRILFFVFYSIEAVLIGETIFTLGLNLWTALVCIVLPQPALRLARNGGEPKTFGQWFVGTFTSVGAT
jgi:hypothetical protein